MTDLYSYENTIQHAINCERLKKPGQDFYKEVRWKLYSKYDLKQRPDDPKIYSDGTLYRTHTMITHIWYKNKHTHENIWITFPSKNKICVKRQIEVNSINNMEKKYNVPNPSKYSMIMFFENNQDVCDYLLSI
jgi:hypothetical protein